MRLRPGYDKHLGPVERAASLGLSPSHDREAVVTSPIRIAPHHATWDTVAATSNLVRIGAGIASMVASLGSPVSVWSRSSILH